jgi:uncharacterized repeat protein (TIGR02543 family)
MDTGDQTLEPDSYAYGTQTTAPETPTMTGYVFEGWYEDAAKEILHTFSTMPDHDVTLYGKWIPETFTMTFDSHGGTPIDPLQTPFGEMVTEPLAPVKEGHDFQGWTYDPETGIPYNFGPMPPYDLTLHAMWTPTVYQMTFETSGGTSVATMGIPYGAPVTEPDDPTRAGMVFGGWYEDLDLTNPYTFTTMPAHDVTLHAAWNVTLSFETFDGSDIDAVTGRPGTPVDAPEDPVLTGHDFTGWYSDQNLTMPYVFDILPDHNKTVYAGWTPSVVTLTFDMNGGDPMDPMVMEIGHPLISIVGQRTDHVFGGWYSEPTFETRVHEVPGTDITLHARWLALHMSSIGTQSTYYVPSNTDDSESDILQGGYSMGVTELTYPVWYEVRQWALSNGYVFQNPGREGNTGTIGALPSGANIPVTTVSLRDVVVFLNALSERSGRTPVYTDGTGNVIKDATTTSADTAVVGSTDGYRLPSRAEWNLAARLLTDPEPLYEVTSTTTGYYTPGDFASGAYRDYQAFDSAETLRVSWFWSNSGNVVHPVGELRANQMGLYDMSGNVAEWCYDLWDDVKHYVMGGGFSRGPNRMQIGESDAYSPTTADYGTGFRVVIGG